MSAFITLPSGCRISSTDIIQYAQHFQQPDKLWIEVRSSVEGENEKLENMTVEQLDNLLNPQQSPMVDPVVNLDNLRPGKGCSFTCEGTHRHGIIASVTSTGVFHILSSGDEYCYDPSINESYPYEG